MMAKEIRMSQINTTVGENNSLDITAHKETGEVSVIYYLDSSRIFRNEEGNSQAITSDKVKVSNLKFYVSKDGNIQPRVTIVMTVESTGQKPEQQAKINLQTTISSRAY
jgi:hypothetical protein